jgi:hypothetical protein
MASKLFGCKKHNVLYQRKKRTNSKNNPYFGLQKNGKNLTSKVATNAKLQTSKFCLIFVIFVNPEL